MKLLIIDDNQEDVSRLTRIIEWKMYGIQEVIHVNNCEEALLIAKGVIPDIIIIDVQEVHAFGIRLKLELHQINPNYKVVVMVSNIDIASLRDIMDIGAVAYFDKRMEVIDVISSIDKVVSAVVERNEREQALRDNLVYKNKELVRLLFRIPHMNSIVRMCDEVEFPIDSNRVYMACYLGNRNLHNEFGLELEGAQTYFKKQGIDLRVGFAEDNYIPCILISEKNNEKYVKDICRRFVVFYNEYIVAVGNGVNTIGELYYSGKRAEVALDKAYFNYTDSYFEEKQLCVSNREEYFLYYEFISKYKKNPFELEAWYTKKIDELKKTYVLGKKQIIALTQAFATVLTKENPMLLEELDDFNEVGELECAMQNAENIDQLKDLFITVLKGLFSYLCEKKRYSLLINSIMEFCFVNIANPKVNCKVIAEHFSYTTTYLNILMKKELRITMKEYLISIRTQRAKDMLSNTLYEVDRISSSCGFSTRDNFTRVFKRVTGMTPSEYRNSFR